MNFSQTPSEGSAGNFLKIKAGEFALGVFRGSPHEFYNLWENGKSKEVPQGTLGARFRFKINFVTKVNGQHTPVVWEQGPTVYNQLKDFNKDFPLEKTIVKISRTGSTKDDTTYTILPLPKGSEVTPQLEETLAALKLNDLKAEAKPQETFAPAAVSLEEELPF